MFRTHREVLELRQLNDEEHITWPSLPYDKANSIHRSTRFMNLYSSTVPNCKRAVLDRLRRLATSEYMGLTIGE
jgi:hypothetical protein